MPDGSVVPPTGRRIDLPAAVIHIVQDGRIVRQDHYFSVITMLTQLGIMPAPEAVTA